MRALRGADPSLVRGYILRALLLWAVLRVALLLLSVFSSVFGAPFQIEPSLPATLAPFLAAATAAITWYDHTKSGENFFHASLGARLPFAPLAVFVTITLVEIVVP